MKNFVNKHTTLLIVLAIMPLNSILYLTSKYIFDYWNLTMLLIQIGLFLIQLISFILVFFVSEEYKIRFKNPIKKLFFWLFSDVYKKYYFKELNGSCQEECPIKKTSSGFIRMVGSMSCQRCENCVDSDKQPYPLWIKCQHVSKRSFNIFSWIKKLFTLLLIGTLLSSCSVYVKCNINKPLQNNNSQQDSTQIESQYWF